MRGKKIISIIVVGIMVLTFFAMPITWRQQKLHSVQDDWVSVDWEPLYPFENDGKTMEEEAHNASFGSKLCEQYKGLCMKLIDSLNQRIPELVYYRQPAIEQYGWLNKTLGIRIIKDDNDTTIALKNGYLTNKQAKSNTADAVKNLTEFSEWTKAQGVDFLYVMCPSKVFGESDIIPGIIDNFETEDKDEIVTSLEDNGVNVLDLREKMPTDYEEYMDLFYRTDHHWKAQTGLWAASLLAERLNHDFGYAFDLQRFQPDAYKVDQYPDLFLGSLGKKTSKSYSGTDDFELLVPEYACNMHIEVPNLEIDQDGDFMTLIDRRKLNYGDEYNLNPYGAMAYGDKSLVQITNKDVNMHKKLLILKDSFADAVTPYLSANCETIDILDLRQFNGSVKRYLQDNEYDTVIVIMRAAGMSYNANSDTNNELWTFE